MNSRIHWFIKQISSVLVVAFSFEQLAFANPDLKPVQLDLFEKPKVNLRFAPSVATVDDAWIAPSTIHHPPSGLTVYLLQDAHTNESGQLNLAKTVETILKKENDLKYVFVEAGFGDSSLSFLKPRASQTHREAVGLSYVKKGLLHGEELLNLTSDELNFTIWGVEDFALYQKAIEAYRYTAAQRDNFKDYLDRIEIALKVLKPRIYNPWLLRFDQIRQKHEKEELSLTEYFDSLSLEAQRQSIPLANFPHLTLLKRLKAKESKIDFTKAGEEQIQAISALGEEDRNELMALAKDNKSLFKLSYQSHEGQKGYFALLEEKVKANTRFARQNYPSLFQYFNYLKLSRSIQPEKILKEMGLLESAVVDRLTRTPDESHLYRSSQMLGSLRKLFSLTLTPEEFSSYKENSRSFGIVGLTGFLNKKIMDLKDHYENATFLIEGFDQIVRHAESFYTITQERDHAFIQNMMEKLDQEAVSFRAERDLPVRQAEISSNRVIRSLGRLRRPRDDKQVAVLITGGYHTPNLKSLLKKQGISYISVRPMVFQETNQKRYETILLNQDLARLASNPKVMMGAARSTARNLQMLFQPAEFPGFVSRLTSGPSASAGARMSHSGQRKNPRSVKVIVGQSSQPEVTDLIEKRRLIGVRLEDPSLRSDERRHLNSERLQLKDLIRKLSGRKIIVPARRTEDRSRIRPTTLLTRDEKSLDEFTDELAANLHYQDIVEITLRQGGTLQSVFKGIGGEEDGPILYTTTTDPIFIDDIESVVVIPSGASPKRSRGARVAEDKTLDLMRYAWDAWKNHLDKVIIRPGPGSFDETATLYALLNLLVFVLIPIMSASLVVFSMYDYWHLKSQSSSREYFKNVKSTAVFAALAVILSLAFHVSPYILYGINKEVSGSPAGIERQVLETMSSISDAASVTLKGSGSSIIRIAFLSGDTFELYSGGPGGGNTWTVNFASGVIDFEDEQLAPGSAEYDKTLRYLRTKFSIVKGGWNVIAHPGFKTAYDAMDKILELAERLDSLAAGARPIPHFSGSQSDPSASAPSPLSQDRKAIRPHLRTKEGMGSADKTGDGARAALRSVNPTQTQAWQALKGEKRRLRGRHLRKMFAQDPGRARDFSEDFWTGKGEIFFDYSKNLITKSVMRQFRRLASQTYLKDAIRKMFSGDRINDTEDRSVLHVALRMPKSSKLIVDGKDVVKQVHKVLNKMKRFSNDVASGKWRGFTSKKITDVVVFGIGGSHLGPEMVTEALRPFAQGKIRIHFVSNVDGADFYEKVVKAGLDPETTLFSVESKTFTTQETMRNAQSAKEWFLSKTRNNKKAIAKHFVAVSTNKKAVKAFGISLKNMFEFWDWVGGRYSFWSAIGLGISIYIGHDNFMELLAGAHDMDEHFRTTPFEHNIPVTMAFLDIWYRNFYGAQTHLVMPYSQYLHRFPAYLQQAFMESNGKGVDRSGNPVNYLTYSIIWGESGTNGQHSYMQADHQGPTLIPADLIGVTNSEVSIADHQQMLLSNWLGQMEALAIGKTLEEVLAEGNSEKLAPHKMFPGNRPTTAILLNRLTPRTLGALVTAYEHQIYAQAAMLNFHPFDQWGVEEGKKRANKILPELKGQTAATSHDASTEQLLEVIKRQRSGQLKGARAAIEGKRKIGEREEENPNPALTSLHSPLTSFGARAALLRPKDFEGQAEAVDSREKGGYEPTLASSFVPRRFRSGIATLMTSLIERTSVSMFVRRSLTSVISSLREPTSSAITFISFLNDSTSAPTWFGVKFLLSLLGITFPQLAEVTVANDVGFVNPRTKLYTAAGASPERSRGARLATKTASLRQPQNARLTTSGVVVPDGGAVGTVVPTRSLSGARMATSAFREVHSSHRRKSDYLSQAKDIDALVKSWPGVQIEFESQTSSLVVSEATIEQILVYLRDNSKENLRINAWKPSRNNSPVEKILDGIVSVITNPGTESSLPFATEEEHAKRVAREVSAFLVGKESRGLPKGGYGDSAVALYARGALSLVDAIRKFHEPDFEMSNRELAILLVAARLEAAENKDIAYRDDVRQELTTGSGIAYLSGPVGDARVEVEAALEKLETGARLAEESPLAVEDPSRQQALDTLTLVREHFGEEALNAFKLFILQLSAASKDNRFALGPLSGLYITKSGQTVRLNSDVKGFSILISSNADEDRRQLLDRFKSEAKESDRNATGLLATLALERTSAEISLPENVTEQPVLFLMSLSAWKDLSPDLFEKKLSSLLAEYGLLTLPNTRYQDTDLFLDVRDIGWDKKLLLERILEDVGLQDKVHSGLPAVNDTGLIFQLVNEDEVGDFDAKYAQTAPRTLTSLYRSNPNADESFTRILAGGHALAGRYAGVFDPDDRVIKFSEVDVTTSDYLKVVSYFAGFVTDKVRQDFTGETLADMAGRRRGLKAVIDFAFQLPTIQAMINKSLTLFQNVRRMMARAA